MFYSIAPPERTRDAADEAAPTLDALYFKTVREQLGATRDASKALMNVWRAAREKDPHLVAPLQAPKSALNQRISRNRRFATQSFEAPRLRRVAKAHGGTLNDVVLALTGSALRRLLGEQAALPDAALTAMIPVNVRPKDDPGGGNAVSAVLATLATDIGQVKTKERGSRRSWARRSAPREEQLQGPVRGARSCNMERCC